MRGFSFGEVNTLYNGIWTGPSDITSRWMGTANLDQVEFLKGPSSIMTGLNAIGGSVNYVASSRPTDRFRARRIFPSTPTARRSRITGPAATRVSRASITVLMYPAVSSTVSLMAISAISLTCPVRSTIT